MHMDRRWPDHPRHGIRGFEPAGFGATLAVSPFRLRLSRISDDQSTYLPFGAPGQDDSLWTVSSDVLGPARATSGIHSGQHLINWVDGDGGSRP